MVFDSKGSHKEGCHVCGGFPGNMSKPVNTLYQCATCSFFTCEKHVSIKTMQKICPNCQSPKLKTAMSQADLRKQKKGGMPGSKRLAEEQNKATKKGKGFTPIAGGGGGGSSGGGSLFGGGGIFGGKQGGDDSDETAKIDKNAEKTTKVKIDPNADQEVTLKVGKDGEVTASGTKKTSDVFSDGDEDESISIKVNIGKGRGDINVSVTSDGSEKKQKVTGYYNTAEEGSPMGSGTSHVGRTGGGGDGSDSNTHAPIPTGLGDQSDVAQTIIEKEDGETITIVLERPGDEDAHGGYKPSGSYNPDGGGGSNHQQNTSSTPVGTGIQVSDIQGTVELNETNIEQIIDAALEDDDVAQQLLDQIDDDELKELAAEYLLDDADDDGDDEKAKKKRKKKSKLLREYTKSLRPVAAKNYNTEQVFKELDKSIDIYIEHPNDETKPNFLNPALPDAFFKPSIEGISSMLNRAGEFYSSKSQGKEKTITIIQFDLSESGRSYYESLLNEDSLVLSAVSFSARNVNNFDDEKLRAALEDIPGVVAVGTVNLDMHFSPHTIDKQKETFKKHIEIAEEYQLPVLISSEKADKELIELLSEIENIKVPLIFASPIENKEILQLCLDRDMYIALRSEISLTPYKDTYLKYIEEIPTNKWLLASGSEFIVPAKDDELYVSNSNNPLIPEVAPEQNKEGKTLVTSDNSFINKQDSSSQEGPADNWNKPELIRNTLSFLVKHFHKKLHPFHRELTENFIHVFNGEAAKEIRQNLKDMENAKKGIAEQKDEEISERKVLIIKAEE